MAGSGFERKNYYVGVIGLIVTLMLGWIGIAAAKNYWPWATKTNPGVADSLPEGYVGTWSGDIDMPFKVPGLGPSAAVVMTLWAGDPMGQDVGSLTVTGPSVAFSRPDCTADLHWQSGDGPVRLTYDSDSATGMCSFVAKLANATITLENSGDLKYQIDISGIRGSSADLYPS